MKENDENTEKLLKVDENMKVADMNIEGMPWHIPGKPLYSESKTHLPPLSKKETIKLMFSAVSAALLVGIIFLFVFFLFILFCIYIWF